MHRFYLVGGVAVAGGAGLLFWLLQAGTVPPPTPVAAIPPVVQPAPPAAAPPLTLPPPLPEAEAPAESGAAVAIDDPRHLACLGLASTNPQAALREAEALRRAGALLAGEHCAAAASLAAGRPAEAAARLERLGSTAEAPSQLRAAWLAQAGQAWLIAEDAQRAYGAASLALVLVPDDPDLLTDRAIAAASLGHPFDAIDDLNKVIDQDPARSEAFVFRASAWRQAGRAELAADDIARALALDADNPEAYLERGLLRAAAGDPARARDDYLRAAELAPGTPTETLARAQLAAIQAR